MYSMDSNYILSGSDDTNIRLWKAHASTPIGVVRRSPRLSVSRDCTFVLVHCSLALVCCYQLHPRQRQKLNYNSALKQRYGHLPEIKRIARYVGAATSWLHHCILFSLSRSLSLALSLSLSLSLSHRPIPDIDTSPNQSNLLKPRSTFVNSPKLDVSAMPLPTASLDQFPLVSVNANEQSSHKKSNITTMRRCSFCPINTAVLCIQVVWC
jgi:hypothetical protein